MAFWNIGDREKVAATATSVSVVLWIFGWNREKYIYYVRSPKKNKKKKKTERPNFAPLQEKKH